MEGDDDDDNDDDNDDDDDDGVEGDGPVPAVQEGDHGGQSRGPHHQR